MTKHITHLKRYQILFKIYLNQIKNLHYAAHKWSQNFHTKGKAIPDTSGRPHVLEVLWYINGRGNNLFRGRGILFFSSAEAKELLQSNLCLMKLHHAVGLKGMVNEHLDWEHCSVRTFKSIPSRGALLKKSTGTKGSTCKHLTGSAF